MKERLFTEKEVLEEIFYVIRRIRHRVSRADMLTVRHKDAWNAYHPTTIWKILKDVKEIYLKKLIRLSK